MSRVQIKKKVIERGDLLEVINHIPRARYREFNHVDAQKTKKGRNSFTEDNKRREG